MDLKGENVREGECGCRFRFACPPPLIPVLALQACKLCLIGLAHQQGKMTTCFAVGGGEGRWVVRPGHLKGEKGVKGWG